jgi:hypothetical protein
MAQIRAVRTREQAPPLAWVPVTGPDGRVRMEMRWHVGSTAGRPRARSAA